MRFFALSFVLLLCLGSAVLHADGVLYDFGLPTANLNNAAGADRSNVAWADGSVPYSGGSYDQALGDSFSFGVAGQTYDITGLQVWIVGSDSMSLSSIWPTLTFLGLGGSTPAVQVEETVNTGGTDPNVNISNASYTDGSTYQGSSGTFINSFYQVDFLNLNWTVQGGETYYFFVDGPSALSSIYGYGVSPFLSASNAALGGYSQPLPSGVDGNAWEVQYDPVHNSIGSLFSFDSNGNGWDKSSDINVEIFGTPEPGSVALLLTALLGTGLLVRKRSPWKRQ